MHFLTRLFRGKPAFLPPLLDPSEGPEPAEVPMSPGGTDPILRLADDWRLPRREARGAVVARLGVAPDPLYGWPAVVLLDAVPLPGALAPWTASAFERIAPEFPITRFTSLVWLGDDAHANLRRTAEAVAGRLGPAPLGRRWNTFVAAWRVGPAEVSLTAWPPPWQSGDLPNPAEQRDPRLRTACRISVATGFRLALSERERDWVRGFRPMRIDGAVGTARTAWAGRLAPGETELESVRDPEDLVADRQRTLGLSRDGEALVVVSDQLHVLPRARILRLEVTRLTPAKGAGGSSLHVLCRTSAPGADHQSVFLAQAADPDGMNALGKDLAARLGCPVEIGPRYPDC